MQALRSTLPAFALADATFRFTVGRPERTAVDTAGDEAVTVFPRFWAVHQLKERDAETRHIHARPSCEPTEPSDADQDEHAPLASPVAPSTPQLSSQTPPPDPTLYAPKSFDSRQPSRLIDTSHEPPKTRKRTRPKTDRRREQCRINQARYRAKLKRRKLESLMGGDSSSNDEVDSCSSNSQSAGSSTSAKPRPRVKTALRMQQCRINQARYRDRQRARELGLEKTIQQVRAEIKQLEHRKLLLVKQGSQLKEGSHHCVVAQDINAGSKH